ncbi:hypothetical protein BKA93DRAFT_748663 [Sparassis latifolia]
MNASAERGLDIQRPPFRRRNLRGSFLYLVAFARPEERAAHGSESPLDSDVPPLDTPAASQPGYHTSEPAHLKSTESCAGQSEHRSSDTERTGGGPPGVESEAVHGAPTPGRLVEFCAEFCQLYGVIPSTLNRGGEPPPAVVQKPEMPLHQQLQAESGLKPSRAGTFRVHAQQGEARIERHVVRRCRGDGGAGKERKSTSRLASSRQSDDRKHLRGGRSEERTGAPRLAACEQMRYAVQSDRVSQRGEVETVSSAGSCTSRESVARSIVNQYRGGSVRPDLSGRSECGEELLSACMHAEPAVPLAGTLAGTALRTNGFWSSSDESEQGTTRAGGFLDDSLLEPRRGLRVILRGVVPRGGQTSGRLRT